PYQQTVARGQYDEQEIEVVRKNMGYTRRFSQKIDLKRAVPTPDLSSSGYCLSAENRQFIFYFPDNGAHWIDLSGTDADQEYEASWFDIQRGAFGRTEKIRGGSRQTVYKPTEDAKVLLLVMD
ncbi:MAG: hypothetical protein KDD15_21870, partial [Lewinella sp.]|nr:hypothetical protein [Lewinella sp.]